MAPHTDIIGVVKELQEFHRSGASNNSSEWQFVTGVQKNFPAIAQALLIAVEALEKTSGHQIDWGNGQGGQKSMVAIDAETALSRIRSLPSV